MYLAGLRARAYAEALQVGCGLLVSFRPRRRDRRARARARKRPAPKIRDVFGRAWNSGRLRRSVIVVQGAVGLQGGRLVGGGGL